MALFAGAYNRIMDFVDVRRDGGIATVVLQRGKVNALNPDVVAELSATFRELQEDPEARGVILTGSGRFFSFGFDVPEFLSYSREEFTAYLESFTALYRDLFVFPKPLVAALNGHTIAGGCMLALACDSAIMANDARIALNEVTFGASLFAGITEILQFRTGPRASEILYSGRMYSAAEALEIGLVSQIAPADALIETAREVAGELASKRPEAFAGMKSLLRRPVADSIQRREPTSIREFVDIWYSEPTWTNLRGITIR
jgi:enoyl-CoA hydratase/carnithine racemase